MSELPQSDAPSNDVERASLPDPAAARIAEIEKLRRSGETSTAIAVAESLAAQFPNRPQPMNQLAVSYLKAGDLASARTALERARDRGLSERRSLQTLLQILWQEGEHQEFIETTERLLEAGGSLTPDQLRQLALCHRTFGQTAEAEQAVDAGLALRKLPLLARLKANLIFERDDDSGIEAEVEALVTTPDMPPEICRAIRLLHRLMAAHSETAKRLATLARQRWPDSGLVDEIYREINPQEDPRVSTTTRSKEEVHGRFAALLRRESWPRQMRKTLIADYVEEIQAQIAPEDLKRDLVKDIKDQEILASPRAPSGNIAFVFTGLADRLALPISALDAYLAAADLTAVYLRDHQRLLFCNGIGTIASNFAATCDALRAIADELDSRTIVTIGNSGGGLAALNYAVEMGAKRSLCFSTPTNVKPEFMKQIGDRRARTVFRRLAKFTPDDLRDVRQRLLTAAPRLAVHLVYGKDMPIDSAHAEHLSDIEGVTLHALSDLFEHGGAPHVLLTGRLPQFIEMVAGD